MKTMKQHTCPRCKGHEFIAVYEEVSLSLYKIEYDEEGEMIEVYDKTNPSDVEPKLKYYSCCSCGRPFGSKELFMWHTTEDIDLSRLFADMSPADIIAEYILTAQDVIPVVHAGEVPEVLSHGEEITDTDNVDRLKVVKGGFMFTASFAVGESIDNGVGEDDWYDVDVTIRDGKITVDWSTL
jgi:hypothetical protein